MTKSGSIPQDNKSGTMVQVLSLVSQRTINNPIPGPSIAEQLGIDIRAVKLCMEKLRLLGFKVGSRKSPPAGYFLARTREEMADTAERMKKECLVQLKQVQRMYVWDGDQPSIFDSSNIGEIENAVREFERATGERL